MVTKVPDNWEVGAIFKVNFPPEDVNPHDNGCAYLWQHPNRSGSSHGMMNHSRVFNGDTMFIVDSAKDDVKDGVWWKVMTSTTLGWLSFDKMEGKYLCPYRSDYFIEIAKASQDKKKKKRIK